MATRVIFEIMSGISTTEKEVQRMFSSVKTDSETLQLRYLRLRLGQVTR